MATSYVQVIDRWFDQYGSVLSGGKIYTYEAGTSTPLATYQDLEGLVANTNPVILDAAGTADIRLTNGVAYKLVLTDSDDVTLDEADDVIIGTADSAAGEEYLLAWTYCGTPGAQAFMGSHIFDRSVTFPANLEGSQAAVETAPSATYAVDVQLNGVSTATISYADTGVPTLTTASGATFDCVAGDVLKFIGPDTGTAGDFSALLVGDVQ